MVHSKSAFQVCFRWSVVTFSLSLKGHSDSARYWTATHRTAYCRRQWECSHWNTWVRLESWRAVPDANARCRPVPRAVWMTLYYLNVMRYIISNRNLHCEPKNWGFLPHALKFDLVSTKPRKGLFLRQKLILNHNSPFCITPFGLCVRPNSIKLVKE